MFFYLSKLKETMSKKESKFHVINFIDPWVIFNKKILTRRAMKTHIQISYKEDKSERRRFVQGL